MSDMSSTIESLVSRYKKQRDTLTRSDSDYSETDVRSNFIDPLFAALGWDLTNERGLPQRHREVIREAQVAVDENTKRPDYAFKLGPERRFFVEAKRPNHNIRDDQGSAFQVRRYGWSAGLWVSVLCNFENLIIYDTTVQPSPDHAATHSRLHLFSFEDYEERFDEIAGLLSREAVYSGEFDKRFSEAAQLRGEEAIDVVFLNVLNAWRLELGKDLLSQKGDIDPQLLNETIQRFILRILFLRMCEDRGIQTYELLRGIAQSNDWSAFMNMLGESDYRFDSELFSIRNDPFFSDDDQKMKLDSTTVSRIIEDLYFPQAPYTFAVFEPEFLGDIYQQFLIERVELENGNPVLVRKPENVDRDVIPTPRPLVDRIASEALEPLIQAATLEELFQLRIIDPACGSGGFLIAAFDLLMDRAVSAYEDSGQADAFYETISGNLLTFEKKRELLQSCLYGVDRDLLAVDVARFSLLVKLLENESPQSLPETAALLPPLEENIVCGDSIVDERVFEDNPAPTLNGIPLTWGEDIRSPYDFVIGNPPYLNTEAMVNLEPTEYQFYQEHYRSAFRQFDKYYVFIERALNDLMDDDAFFGMVVSRKFTHIESGKRLRGLISRGRHLVRLIDFGSAQLFRGRTTYICLLILSKAGMPVPNEESEDSVEYELVTTPGDWLRGFVGDAINQIKIPRKLVEGDKAWLLPSTPEELELILTLFDQTQPLSDLFDVFNGIQTSLNSVYVIPEWIEESAQLIRFAADGQDWPVEKSILKPFFDDNCGELVSFNPMPDTARVIFPYSFQTQQDGSLRAQVISPGLMQQNYPRAFEWLEHNEAALKKRAIQPAPYPPDEWYRFGRDQALTSFDGRDKIVVGVNSQGDKYVYDDTETLLATGGTAGECAIAQYRPPKQPTAYDLYFALAILNHKAIEFFCRKRGSPFRGGWFARGTAVLKDVPVPVIRFDDPDGDNGRLQQYNQVVAASRVLCTIHRRLQAEKSAQRRLRLERRASALKRQMDLRISDLYGVAQILDKVELPS